MVKRGPRFRVITAGYWKLGHPGNALGAIVEFSRPVYQRKCLNDDRYRSAEVAKYVLFRRFFITDDPRISDAGCIVVCTPTRWACPESVAKWVWMRVARRVEPMLRALKKHGVPAVSWKRDMTDFARRRGEYEGHDKPQKSCLYSGTL